MLGPSLCLHYQEPHDYLALIRTAEACQRVNIDLKTAEAYEPGLKAARQQMDKTKR